MQVTRFDADVAAAHGYEIKTLPDGTRATVKQGDATPSNTVNGDCGSSYLYLDPRPHGYAVRTGFHVIHRAVSYSWAVDVYGPTGKRFTWGGGLRFRNDWSGTASSGAVRAGEYFGLASSPTYAILWDGSICTSGHPFASVVVF
jgi:hypothetical protein